jgi:hypothetical protein
MSTLVERVGLYSILVNLVLLALNLVMAGLSGSLALAAETTHNLADLTASGAVLVGLKLSQRTHRAFPYGLYKVENVVSLVVAFFIFFTAYEVAKEALSAGNDRWSFVRCCSSVSAWQLCFPGCSAATNCVSGVRSIHQVSSPMQRSFRPTSCLLGCSLPLS